MAPSLLAVGTAALACVGSAAAKQWYLRDTYDASNFFDKFDFVTVWIHIYNPRRYVMVTNMSWI